MPLKYINKLSCRYDTTATVLLLPSRCYCLAPTIPTLPSHHYCLAITILMLPLFVIIRSFTEICKKKFKHLNESKLE